MDNSRYYFKYPEKIEDRIDENYNNPYYDKIEELLEKARFEVVQLGNKDYLFNITSGKTPRGIHYLDEGGIPFLGATQIVDERVFVEDAPRIEEELHTGVLKGSQIKKGDVLVTMAGFYIGRCAVFESDEESNCNQAVAILRLNKKRIIPQFLSNYLNSNIGQLFFGKLKHIAGQPNINLDEILKIKVILPDNNEQDRILKTILPIEDRIKKVQDKIEQLKIESSKVVLNELNFPISEKLYSKKWFFKTGADLRSPYFAVSVDNLSDRLHYLFYNPELEVISDFKGKYTTITLEEIGHPQKGKQPDYTEQDSDILAIKTVDLKDEYIDYQNCLRTTEECYSKFPVAHVEKHDILVACTGYVSMGKVDVYDSENKAMAAQDLCILRLEKGYDPYFLTYFLRSPIGKAQFERWWIGSSGQIHLEPEDLNKFEVPRNSKDGVPFTKQIEIANKVTEKLVHLRDLKSLKEKLIEEKKLDFEKQTIVYKRA